MKNEKLLLLKVFVMDHFDNPNFKVTYLPSLGKAIVEDIDKNVIFITARDNNIVECSEGFTCKVFRKLQMIETFHHSYEYAWRVL